MEIPQRRPPKKNPHLGLRLAIAAVVLLAIGVLIFILAKKNTPAAPNTGETTAPTTHRTPP